MALRFVLMELETRLEPVAPNRAGKGKLEFKRYKDGKQRMKIKCRGLDLPDGARLELRSGDTLIANLAMKNGRAEVDEERADAAEAPPLAEGDVVTLRHDGVPLLRGEIYRD